MSERKVIRIPNYMRPRPWRHLLAWLFRTTVPTTDYITWEAGDRLLGEADRWRKKYEHTQGRIDDLILEHTPTLRDPEYLTSGWDRDRHLEFACSSPRCPFMWPCPSFQWARGEKYEPLRVQLVKKTTEEE